MELLLILVFALGLWMNWTFAFHNKHKWINLETLRNLVSFQLTLNALNIAFHLLLLIPLPFFGYAINPGNFLWTFKSSIVCRLLTVMGDFISISCSANATIIFITNPEAQELKQERRRKQVCCVCIVMMCFCLGRIFVFSFRELIDTDSLIIQNCPSHSFFVLCDQKEVKYLFTSFSVLSFLLFCYLGRSSILELSELWNSFNFLILFLAFSHKCCIFYAMTYGLLYTPAYLFGGPSLSVTFSLGKHYFDIVTLALSIGLPAFLAHVFAKEDLNGCGI